jgi:hypothetical protein
MDDCEVYCLVELRVDESINLLLATPENS